MSYFTPEDHMTLLSVQANGFTGEAGLQRVHNRLLDLHSALYSRLRKYNIDLHADIPKPNTIQFQSVAGPFEVETMALVYMRPTSQAHVVEGIIGRNTQNSSLLIELQRHPVIELRLTPYAFTVELVIAPQAWYDQQNLAGKLTIPEHRATFHKILSQMTATYCIGFWGGLHLDNMHFSTNKLPPARVLLEWMDTFAAGRDWIRVGAWYQPGNPALAEDTILNTVFDHVRELSALYTFAAWSSNNNFHSFYKNVASPARR